jgi:hypothetical protein
MHLSEQYIAPLPCEPAQRFAQKALQSTAKAVVGTNDAPSARTAIVKITSFDMMSPR